MIIEQRVGRMVDVEQDGVEEARRRMRVKATAGPRKPKEIPCE